MEVFILNILSYRNWHIHPSHITLNHPPPLELQHISPWQTVIRQTVIVNELSVRRTDIRLTIEDETSILQKIIRRNNMVSI